MPPQPPTSERNRIELFDQIKAKKKKGKSPERPRTVIRMIISYSTIAPLMMMSPIVKACLCT